MDCETCNSGYKSPRRSSLVPPIGDIETGTVMFITLYSNITLKHFQELLTTQLIGEYCSRKKVSLHFPAKKQSTNSERKRGMCSLCWERNHCSDTQWFCNECGVWLCHPGTLNDCFLLWHKRRVYCITFTFSLCLIIFLLCNHTQACALGAASLIFPFIVICCVSFRVRKSVCIDLEF